jgi:DNA-binding transcriptional MerR regulator
MFTAAASSSWTLDELAAEAQRLLQRHGLLGAQPDARVSAAPDARTVRYYTTLGLLDRPAIVGRQARYSGRHARQLLAIKALQAAGLPLAAIQERLFGRSVAELEAVVESLAAQTGRPQTRKAPPALRLRELSIAPGLRLLVEDGFEAGDVEALLARVRAALEQAEQD